MPKKFDSCVSGGGRVRTVKPKPSKHVPVCFPTGGGPSVAGEVKTTRRRRIPK